MDFFGFEYNDIPRWVKFSSQSNTVLLEDYGCTSMQVNINQGETKNKKNKK